MIVQFFLEHFLEHVTTEARESGRAIDRLRTKQETITRAILRRKAHLASEKVLIAIVELPHSRSTTTSDGLRYRQIRARFRRLRRLLRNLKARYEAIMTTLRERVRKQKNTRKATAKLPVRRIASLPIFKVAQRQSRDSNSFRRIVPRNTVILKHKSLPPLEKRIHRLWTRSRYDAVRPRPRRFGQRRSTMLPGSKSSAALRAERRKARREELADMVSMWLDMGVVVSGGKGN
jgi:hypothetical protein